MDYEIGYCVIITVIIMLMLKTVYSRDAICFHKIDKPILIKCKQEIRNVTVNNLIVIFDKLGFHIKRCIHIVDEYNCNPLNVVVRKSRCSLEKWMSVQNDPLFTKAYIDAQNNDSLQGEIQEEKDILSEKINTLSELTSSSKLDDDDPIEDIQDPNTFDLPGSPTKTKRKLMSLAKDLFMAINILSLVQYYNSQLSYASGEMLDITHMEELMYLLNKLNNDTGRYCFPQFISVAQSMKI